MDELLNQLVLADFSSTEGKIMFGLIIASMVCGVIGKAIPDDKGGVLGVVRKVSKVGGLVLSNRISAGVSVNDVAKGRVIPDEFTNAIADVASSKVERAADRIIPALVQTAVDQLNPISGKPRANRKS